MYIILKFSEIFTKTKRVKENFLKILENNIRSAFERENFQGTLFVERDKILIISDSYNNFFQRIFGVKKVVVAERVNFEELRDLKERVAEIFGDKVKNNTFGVRVKRKGVHSFSSLEAEREIGSLLVEKGGKVNLKNPSIWVKLEIEDHKAYVTLEEFEGAGGLPLSSQGKVLCLVSGGFDSIVASYMLAKRGTALSFLFFNLGGYSHLRGVVELLNYFYKSYLYGIEPELIVCDLRPIVEDIRGVIPSSYWGIVLKRRMFEIAEIIAEERGFKVIATGESLGQVSSQTLDSLFVIEKILKKTICLRPLLGFDKEEIINLARKIGTYEFSSKVKEYCAIVPEKPVTRPKLEDIEKLENLLEKKLIQLIPKSARVLYPPYKIEEEDIEIEKVPEGAIKVDIREKYGAESILFNADLRIPKSDIDKYDFDKDKIYVIFCNYGLFSQEVAIRLRERGIRAYAYKGGIVKYRG
ncbi:MAG: tRNA uracil 4-sulfurtransferase ThiI [Candidatus Hydrothermales bacterium]